MKPHLISIEDVARELATRMSGLSKEEAAERLVQYGPNELKEHKSTPAWWLFLRQFLDIMILILGIAAGISALLGDIPDTIIILVIIFLNAVIGFIQEYSAEKAIASLRNMAITEAKVIRDGSPVTIHSGHLVPGDLVVLAAGDMVPADIRLIEANALRADESMLTGESVPVDKEIGKHIPEDAPIGDRVNMTFKGTLVTNGNGKGLVVATGMHTELGKIAGMLEEKTGPTPLQQRMNAFGKNLSYLIVLICLILFAAGILRGEDPYAILLLAVSLAVAAIPEALPALITVALSRGAARLAGKKALIRQLPAVETLGSVSFICSDKTGTLTENRMTVTDVKDLEVRGEQDKWTMLQAAMALNHEVLTGAEGALAGDPTEVAMVEFVRDQLSKKNWDEIHRELPKVAELPFDPDRKCMTTIHHYKGHFLILTKGAIENMAAIMKEADVKMSLVELSGKWSGEGRRVLAFAYREVAQLPSPFNYQSVEKDLLPAGIIGMLDPPRKDMKRTMKACRQAGIHPVMITGDHPATALAIARQIGLTKTDRPAVTGNSLDGMSEEELQKHIRESQVFARVSPAQKLRIIRSLQESGHFVAMTGDGVNDAPSLKAADIGVAMGIMGTDVARQASDLVLLDDRYATILTAVEEGRRIFDNIRKFVKYIMTCNGAEIATIVLAPLVGMPIPLLPIHILWINLVTDGLPALALADEKAEEEVMKRPPRPPGESLFAHGLGYHIVWVGLLMAGVTLGVQAWALSREIDHWQTLVFTVLALSQLGHVLAVRSERSYLFQRGLFSNKPLLLAVFLTFLLQMAVVYLPVMNEWFHTHPLTLEELAVCLGLSLVVFHAVELEKFIRSRMNGSGRSGSKRR